MKRAFLCCLLVVMVCCFTACGDSSTPTAATTVPTTKTTALPSVGWITADSLRVRGGAGLRYSVIGGLALGDRVEITGKTGDWYSIRFGETQTGYVSGQYLTFTAPAQ